jgi:hypothetical protein
LFSYFLLSLQIISGTVLSFYVALIDLLLPSVHSFIISAN